MNTLSKSDLKLLLEKGDGACASVSIYMPTQKTGVGVKQNSIKLKNLLRDAEERLVGQGMRRPETVKLLARAAALPDDDVFWRHQSEGLAVFISREVFQSYHVPLDFKDSVTVAGRFQVKPLLPIFTGDGIFYVLALSQNQVRLLQCSHYGAREMDLTGIVPGSLAEVVGPLGTQRQQSHHASTQPTGRSASTVFTGQNLGDEAKNNIIRFFQQVNKGIHQKVLREENAPLLLAAVDFLHPLYKSTNTYPYLYAKGVTGNTEGLSPQELHKKAWAIIRPFFDTSHQEALTEFRQMAGSGHTSEDIVEIVSGAYAGDVELLFVALDVQKWGAFDAKSNTADLHEKEQSCDEDLLDFAAAHTLMHRGKVYAVKPAEVPGSAGAAAVFRHERHSGAAPHRKKE